MSNDMFDGELKQLLKFKRVVDDEERAQHLRVFLYIDALEAAVKAAQEMHENCPADDDTTEIYKVAVRDWRHAIERLSAVQEGIREELLPKVPYQDEIEELLVASGFHTKGVGRGLVEKFSKLMKETVDTALGEAAVQEYPVFARRKKT